MTNSRERTAVALTMRGLVLALPWLSMPALAGDDWLAFGGNAGGQQYSPLAQINTGNVAGLEVAWEYRTGELECQPALQLTSAKVQVNPVLLPAEARGYLAVCTPFGRVIALDLRSHPALAGAPGLE